MKVHKLLIHLDIYMMSVLFLVEIKFVVFVAKFYIIKLLLLPDIIFNVPSGHYCEMMRPIAPCCSISPILPVELQRLIVSPPVTETDLQRSGV